MIIALKLERVTKGVVLKYVRCCFYCLLKNYINLLVHIFEFRVMLIVFLKCNVFWFENYNEAKFNYNY